tara:strand:- start:90 stop:2057 length:1968 start_codon:yes stop_codon:yes gene_type:complete
MAINRSGIASLFKEAGIPNPLDEVEKKRAPNTYGARLEQVFQETSPIYERVIRETAGDPEERRRQAQAQALFALAQTGLAFASPTQAEIAAGQRFSPAERLAQSIEQTKLFPTIAALGAQEQKAKDAERKAIQAARLSALSSAEQKLTAETKAQMEAEAARLASIRKMSEMGVDALLKSTTAEKVEKTKDKYLKQRLRLQSTLDTSRQKIVEALKSDNKIKQIDARAAHDAEQTQVKFENLLEQIEIQNTYKEQAATERARVNKRLEEIKGDNRIDAIRERANLQRQRDDLNNKFRAQESLKKFERQRELAEIKQQYDFEQREIDRKIKEIQFQFKKADANRKAELQERKFQLETQKNANIERQKEWSKAVENLDKAALTAPLLFNQRRTLEDGSTKTTMELWSSGQLGDPDEDRALTTLTNEALRGEQVWDPKKGTFIYRSANFTPEQARAIVRRQNLKKDLRPDLVHSLQALVLNEGDLSRKKKIEAQLAKKPPSYLQFLRNSPEDRRKIAESLGITGFGEDLGFRVAQIFGLEFGSDGNEGGAILKNLNNQALLLQLEANEGKDNKELQQIMNSMSPKPFVLSEGPKGFINKTNGFIAKLKADSAIIIEQIKTGAYAAKDYMKKLAAAQKLQSLAGDYEELVNIVKRVEGLE